MKAEEKGNPVLLGCGQTPITCNGRKLIYFVFDITI